MNVGGMRGPSGAELLKGDNADVVAMLRDVLLQRAYEARTDIVKFTQFVMREENTRSPIKVAPHQAVFLDFVMKHPRSVNRLPIGHSKTFALVALTLFILGNNPNSRGGVVSATQEIASKVVMNVRDYIDTSLELKLVFPHLRRSSREGDPWTQTKITIERPAGIRDASLTAYGIGGGIAGARLNWIIVDDLLSPENTYTDEQRMKTLQWLDIAVLSRLDPRDARVVVTNTPYHYQDVLHRLEEIGWASLRMDVEGGIWIKDDRERMEEGFPAYDHPLLLPEDSRGRSMLDAYHSLPPRERTLWPLRMDRKKVEQERQAKLDHDFQRLYMCVCTNDATARCKQEYIDRCLEAARDRGVHELLPVLPDYMREYPVFTGVDLAFGQNVKQHDMTAFFTFAVLPSKHRQILDIDIGQWDAPTMLAKAEAKNNAYGSIFRIENVAAQQMFVDMVERLGIVVYPHKTTASGKADPTHGIESMFAEMKQGLWLIPNTMDRKMSPVIRRFISNCLNYTPDKHVADELMAGYFAREQAREFGATTDEDVLAAAADIASRMAIDLGVR